MSKIITLFLWCLLAYTDLVGNIADDIDHVSQYMSGSGFNEYDPETGFHPLTKALRANDLEGFRNLLAFGADPNAPSREGFEKSVGETILESLFKEPFLISALDFGFDPNKRVKYSPFSEEKSHILLKCVSWNYQQGYFFILERYGAEIHCDEEKKKLVARALKLCNFRAVYYLLKKKYVDVEVAIELEEWKESFSIEPKELGNNALYWRNKIIELVNEK